MNFYVGLHQPGDARHFNRCMISVNRLTGQQKRVSMVRTKSGGEWIMDSGAFSRISRGEDHLPIKEYARCIEAHTKTIGKNLFGNLIAAVCQDYMCEPYVLGKTGLSVREHQCLTIERYEALTTQLEAWGCPTYIMPVLQGYAKEEYLEHLQMWDLPIGAWAGVGSICKRNGQPEEVAAVLRAIKTERPDLRLHGFGLKLTYFDYAGIHHQLYSADSMAWSKAKRKIREDPNHWHGARDFVLRINQALC